MRACARADGSTLRDQVGPVRPAAICAALTKNYAGRSNQPLPGSVASAKCRGSHRVADVLRLGRFGFMLRASQGWPDMLVRLLLVRRHRDGGEAE
jgi:hypothetical protein